MRLGVVIVVVGVIAVALVRLRTAEMSARHQLQREQVTHLRLRRELSEQEVRLSRLMVPVELRARIQALGPPSAERDAYLLADRSRLQTE